MMLVIANEHKNDDELVVIDANISNASCGLVYCKFDANYTVNQKSYDAAGLYIHIDPNDPELAKKSRRVYVDPKNPSYAEGETMSSSRRSGYIGVGVLAVITPLVWSILYGASFWDRWVKNN